MKNRLTEMSKRDFLSGLATCSTAAAIALSASASLISKVKAARRLTLGAANETLLATLTFQNTDKSKATPAESYVTFGMAFKKEDVTSSETPALRRADNEAAIPAQFDLRNTWSDGSLRWCEVSCIAPSIGPGEDLEVEVYAVTDIYDNTPTRPLTDITGNTDFTVKLTNCTDYLGSIYEGGTLEASLNDNAGSAALIKSGPVCDQWRIWAPFVSQTNDHLKACFYVTAWTKDRDGSLGPISHIAKVHNGYLNLAGVTKYYYDAVYKDGASTLQSFTSSATFTVASSTTLTVTGHGMLKTQSVIVSSSGTLPTGLTANTVYYAYPVDANTITLHTLGAGAQSNNSGTRVTVSGGSGTHTIRKIIAHYDHSDWVVADTDGKSYWTASEPTIFVGMDREYLHSTKLIPPTDLAAPTVTPPFTAAYAPFVNTSTDNVIWNSFAYSGTSEGAPLPQWAINAFLSQTSTHQDTARIMALVAACFPGHWLNEATNRIPTMRGTSATGASGTYSNMGALFLTARYFSPSSNSGVVAPPINNTGPWHAATGFEFSHMKDMMYYTILTEGGAHLIDIHLSLNNFGMWNRQSLTLNATGTNASNISSRIVQVTSIDPVNYAVISFSAAGNQRGIAWQYALMASASVICPDAWPEHDYIDDILYLTGSVTKTFLDNHRADDVTGNFYVGVPQWEFTSNFMVSFLVHGVCRAYAVTEDANHLTFLNYLLRKYDGPINQWSAGCPEVLNIINIHASSDDSSTRPPLYHTTWDTFGSTLEVTLDATTDRFTVTNSYGFSIADGCKVRFCRSSSTGAYPTPLPTGLDNGVWYFMRDVRGSTFKVAETLNGTAIGFIDDPRSAYSIAFVPNSCPGALVNPLIGTAYMLKSASACAHMAALGVTGADDLYATLIAFINTPAAYAQTTEWAMQPTFAS